ncbi:unnamed protein product [Pedinophyceae sp. YPF-701]|nr:unnamed protein product [Pedinophyceae sp. YPF-701]
MSGDDAPFDRPKLICQNCDFAHEFVDTDWDEHLKTCLRGEGAKAGQEATVIHVQDGIRGAFQLTFVCQKGTTFGELERGIRALWMSPCCSTSEDKHPGMFWLDKKPSENKCSLPGERCEEQQVACALVDSAKIKGFTELQSAVARTYPEEAAAQAIMSTLAADGHVAMSTELATHLIHRQVFCYQYGDTASSTFCTCYVGARVVLGAPVSSALKQSPFGVLAVARNAVPSPLCFECAQDKKKVKAKLFFVREPRNDGIASATFDEFCCTQHKPDATGAVHWHSLSINSPRLGTCQYGAYKTDIFNKRRIAGLQLNPATTRGAARTFGITPKKAGEAGFVGAGDAGDANGAGRENGAGARGKGHAKAGESESLDASEDRAGAGKKRPAADGPKQASSAKKPAKKAKGADGKGKGGGRAGSKDSEAFEHGDPVWAMVRGFGYYPGVVVDPGVRGGEYVKKNKDRIAKGMSLVQFLDKDVQWVSRDKVFPLEDEWDKFSEEYEHNGRPKPNFDECLAEAEACRKDGRAAWVAVADDPEGQLGGVRASGLALTSRGGAA